MTQHRRTVLQTVGVAGLAGITVPSATRAGQADHETIVVPDDQPTIGEAVDDAEPGTLVVLEAGTYEGGVEVTTPEITIRGVDRNDVVLDGEFDRNHGIEVEADGVALENMTARHYEVNAFYWRYVEGFREVTSRPTTTATTASTPIARETVASNTATRRATSAPASTSAETTPSRR